MTFVECHIAHIFVKSNVGRFSLRNHFPPDVSSINALSETNHLAACRSKKVSAGRYSVKKHLSPGIIKDQRIQ